MVRKTVVHADAAYCTPLRKYLLAVQTHRAGKQLLYSSPDGLDWSLETILDEVANGAIQPIEENSIATEQF
jgi:hypothetical protein